MISLNERFWGISADQLFKEDLNSAGLKCLNCGFEYDEHTLRRGQSLCPQSMLSEADIQRIVKRVIAEMGRDEDSH